MLVEKMCGLSAFVGKTYKLSGRSSDNNGETGLVEQFINISFRNILLSYYENDTICVAMTSSKCFDIMYI